MIARFRIVFKEKRPGAKNLYYMSRRLIRIVLSSGVRFPSLTLKVMLGITYRCQCDCSYCGISPYSKDRPELSRRSLEEIIDQIAVLPYPFICLSFFGGEPLLRNDIYSLISHAVRKGLLCEVETNGVLLNSDNVENLRSAGVSHLFVNMDSADGARHDSIKKLSAYEAALDGIARCKKADIPCSISKCVSDEGLLNNGIKEIIKLGKRIGVATVRLLPLVDMALWKGAGMPDGLKRPSADSIKSFLEPGFVYLESTGCDDPSAERSCAFLSKEFFYISPYGEVQPCPYFPVSFGDLTEYRLQEVLGKMHGEEAFSVAGCADCAAVNTLFLNYFGRASRGKTLLINRECEKTDLKELETAGV